jgi:UDP-glucose 4-epimerase
MALHLITGGAGFIGSSIAETLLAQGERVRILDDFSSGRRENVDALRAGPDKLEVLTGTVVDPATVAGAMKGVEVVFHEAAIPSVTRSVEDPQGAVLAGVQGTTVVLDEARRAGVRRFVFAASSAAYGDGPLSPKVETMPPQPLSPYAVSKLAGEHLVRVFAELYGMETVSLRYFNIFGPRQDPKSEYAAVVPRFITAVLRGEQPIVFGDGEQTRDFCFVDNAVRANLLAATTSSKLRGQVVNVACGQKTSLNELLAHIGELAGVRVDAEHRPGRAGDIRDSLADVSAARALLAYEPTIDVREGLRRTFDAFAALAKK